MSAASQSRGLLPSSVASIALYGIPIVIRLLTTLGVVPIYTRVLTPADYGVLELLDLTSFVVASLIGSNFGVSVFYYYGLAKDDVGKRNLALSTAFLGSFVLAAVCLVPLLGGGVLSGVVLGSPDYAGPLRIAVATVAVSFPAEVGLCCLRAQNRVPLYSAISSIRLVVTSILTLILMLVYKFGLESLLWSSLVMTIVTGVTTGILCREAFSGGFDPTLFWHQIRYSWPLSVSAMAVLILDFGDRYVLRRHVSLADIGVYGLAYKFGMMVALCSLVFNHYWKPRMFAVVQGEGGKDAFVRTYTYYVLVLATVVVGLSTVAPPILSMIVGKEFRAVLPIIPWVAAIYLIRVSGDYFRNAFYLAKATVREAQLTWMGAGICVALYFLLIPLLQLWGAIVATAISYSVMWMVSLRAAQKVMHFPYDFRRVFLCMGWMLVIVVARWAAGTFAPEVSSVAGVLLLLAWPAGLWAAGWFEEAEIAEARRVWSLAWGRFWVARRLSC